ncbi:MAG: LysM peptidoglycan-binding domain-containing protein [Chloroflexota bacterium]|nr:MAG: LysM peptidoglycan-binding domain-containing protein [Chloroflexota bacterium]
MSRRAGHLLILGLACAVGATSVFTPVRQAVQVAFETAASEAVVSGESALARGSTHGDETPVFRPLTGAEIARLRPRQAVTTHRVAAGDSVSGLAERYRISPQTLIWANNIDEPNRLKIGDVLLVLSVSGVLHVVDPSDTVGSLAERYRISAEAIVDVNGLIGEVLPAVGAAVVIPGGRPPTVARTVSPPTAPSVAPAPTSPRDRERSTIAAQREASARPPTSPEALKPKAYVVEDGDSLLTVARKFGISTSTIAFANALTAREADNIVVGQKLVVPPVDGVLHRVEEGETARGIAAKYGIETLAVVRANGLAEPFVVVPGQRLIVPGAAVPDPRPEPPIEVAPRAPPAEYKVAVGDSIVSIAAKFGIDPRALVRRNQLDRADLIAPGQSLAIPTERSFVEPVAVPRAVAVARLAPAPPVPNVARASAPSAPRPPAPSQPTAPAPKPAATGVIDLAMRYLGFAYTWGGHTPSTGFDCTGFTYFVFDQAGRYLPNHDLWGQLQSGPRVDRGDLNAGDLVFFTNTYMPGLSHVGIYLGANRFVHSGSERTGVTVTSLDDPYWAPRYYGATRPA